MQAEPSSIGERIRQLRGECVPRMTQQELAERAGLSIDVVRKLEQGRRQTVLIGTLHALARALDVDVSALMSRPRPLATSDGSGYSGIRGIRRSLTASDELLPVNVEIPASDAMFPDLRRSIALAWGSYWTGDYDTLGSLLPTLIAQARVADHGSTAQNSVTAAALLAEAYQVTGCALTYLGYIDLAHLALERALAAIRRGDDPLMNQVNVASSAWLLLKQGRFEEAQHMAVAEAERCEPRISTATPVELAVWGTLLVTAASAAARSGASERAQDLLNVADTAATRIGADRNDYQVTFGPARVVMQSVDTAVVSGRFEQALTTAAKMPAQSVLPLAARARHLTDIAYAQTNLGKDGMAVETLLHIERSAPNWMRFQTFPKVVVRELLERERRARTPRLRGLANRLGLSA